MHMYEAIGVWPLGTGKPVLVLRSYRATRSRPLYNVPVRLYEFVCRCKLSMIGKVKYILIKASFILYYT